MQIKRAARALIPQMGRLWAEAFGEGDPFCGRFFEDVFRPDDSLVALQGETLCAMLHTVRCEITLAGKKNPARYLYAVATAAPFRGRGVFRTLHETLLRESPEEYFLLIPQEESLRAFYRGFDYETVSYAPCVLPVFSGGQTELSVGQAWEIYCKNREKLTLCLERESFFLTALDKRFFTQEGAESPFYVESEGEITSFFEVPGARRSPTAMCLSKSGEKPREFVLPFFLN